MIDPMFRAGDYVTIQGWLPGLPDGVKLYGLVLQTNRVAISEEAHAYQRCVVKLLSGTTQFPEGEIHEYPSTMLEIMEESEQERLV